jgi:predicted RecB family endonuclease
MNMLAGSVALSGEYNTQDIKVPSVNFNADLRQIDVASSISSFEILQKILPQAQNYAGKASATLTLNSVLDEHLSPELNTVVSKGQLQTHSLKIQNSELFGAMATLLKNEAWRTPTLNNINIKFEIKDGQLTIEPIRMNIAQTALELTGGQGLDMSLNYKVNAAVPVSVIGSGATDILGKIPGGSNIREIKVAGLITGTPSKPVVTLSVADMVSNVVETVKEAVTEQVQAVTQQSKEEVKKQITAIMAEAERQAQNVRNTAKQSADAIRNEANSRANQLEAAAKDPLSKIAAQAAAKKLRDEGNASAAKIEQEADKQATAIMDAARKKADGLRQ